MRYYSVHVVKKLNSETDSRVVSVCNIIKEVVSEVGVQLIARDKINSHTLVIAVGGDGTMLEAMRMASFDDAVAMGINLGKVGFLTDFAADDNLKSTLKNILTTTTNIFPIEKRIGIDIVPTINGFQTKPAFNEYVISTKHNDGLISYDLQIGEMHAGSHSATSLIIGVPTGSTAYGLSAGGPLILPSMKVFQIIPLAPISMTSRPIIVPSGIPITVQFNASSPISVRADGQEIITSHTPLNLTFIEYDSYVQLLHSPDWNFFDMLTTKLGWRKD